MPGVYILLCPQEEKVLVFLHIQVHNHENNLNHCLWLYYYDKFIVELEKKHKQQKKTKCSECLYYDQVAL